MIKAFLFDWGGVMSSDGGRGGQLAQRLAHNLCIPDTLAQTLIGSIWGDFVAGKIDETAVWKRIEAGYGKPIGKLMRKVWITAQISSAVPEMRALVSRLRKNGFTVGLVSNVIPPTAAEIRSQGGYDLFDFTVLSYEVGVAKPDLRIYQLAMANLSGISSNETVFIDDQQRCLEPAAGLGMHTILAKNPEQIAAAVQALL